MKYYIILALGFIVSFQLHGQNLVPNPGFEDVNCPTVYTGFPNQIDQYVNGWRSGNCASPDIYAACSQDSITRPPAAWYGSEMPHMGSNFTAVGFYTIGPTPWYEYLVCKLDRPLQAGNQYSLSFWASRADSSRYATAEFGMAFSPTLDTCVSGFEGPVLPYSSALTASNIITQTNGWTQIRGTYTATGNEQYLLLGCFTPWDQLSVQDFGSGQNRCYYYLDDVEVSPLQPASLAQDIGFMMGPNPVGAQLVLKTGVRGVARIRDLQGREITAQPIQAQTETRIAVAQLPAGAYICEFRSGKGIIRKRFLKIP